ncbi:L-aspartate dehydrogenase [Raoultella terrigena]|uniref:L-aspartate dehydrogenase n=1 Tax=Raoultella terrigena TaxID=577 RepID=A0A4U9D351_RAOTE|nr:L-aspartate dehydrogenase [Raoultella terrigena]
MKKIMLIGYGAMAQAVIERLPPQVALGWVVAREAHHAAIRQRFGDAVAVLDDPQSCAETPDLVLECASQQAVAQFGEAILRRGWHLAVISTGALADSELEKAPQRRRRPANSAFRRGGRYRRPGGCERGRS